MTYADRIRSIVPASEPRHVEAWMRSEHGTLDHLSPEQFVLEAQVAADLAAIDPAMSEALAQSFGLTARKAA
ncbi:MAG TPA: hypothetical protein VFT69_16965 [Pseudolabrys sp.]|nr:hypothetical protein [Pseudolabrys sp.]